MSYTNYATGGGDLPVAKESILIRGGAGVANDRLITPRGVATAVSEEEVSQLRENKVFQMHEENGYVMVSQSYVDPDEAAADMTGRDVSAPIVAQDSLVADAETVVGGEVVAN